MEVEKKTKDFKSLAKVVEKANLRKIFLQSANVWRELDMLEELALGANISISGELLENRQDGFVAKTVFSLKGESEEENEDVVARIECEYVLEYALDDRKGLTDEDIVQFCKMNSVYNSWPYWREFVQNLTNRMELPTLTLPLLKFRRSAKKSDKAKKNTT